MIVIMSNKYRMILTRMLCKMMRGIAVHTAHKTSFLQKRRNRSWMQRLVSQERRQLIPILQLVSESKMIRQLVCLKRRIHNQISCLPSVQASKRRWSRELVSMEVLGTHCICLLLQQPLNRHRPRLLERLPSVQEQVALCPLRKEAYSQSITVKQG